MAASVISICNMALARVGVSSFISSLTEPSNEARVCALFYEQMRDYALRDYPWNFANTRVALSEAGDAPTNWEYMYVYPSDCLKARAIVPPGLRAPRSDQRIPFETGYYNGQRVIYSNLDQAELIYTKRIEDPTIFDPMFASALSYLIAAEIAMPLAVQPKVAEQARSAYMMVASSAAASNLTESTEQSAPDSEFIAIRGVLDGQQPNTGVVYGG
jgi:hypothetical protein